MSVLQAVNRETNGAVPLQWHWPFGRVARGVVGGHPL